ncbi:MAG: hypothetical protein US96_C0007G0023 [Candidatus Woesebacteria bacterium GW2011_GWB1_38_5b]|uniref:Uncharacterized protein n=1 Tax=Candidatus Woesebacteria bacterium GW2011_GWB1_38_5b TaxID=1618569 RepID=A0A0G0KJJ2_9BACT|nr:MAG: hypothetical protein US96_C0007G0023 [Candidatus Woesebacteria bacterium GW2011_GWB1_38_5b]
MVRIIVPHNHSMAIEHKNGLVVLSVNTENPEDQVVYAFVLPVGESLANLGNYDPEEILVDGDTFSLWENDFFTVVGFTDQGAAEIEFP